MGGADVIPGVSGGTVALIVGIYSRLIASIRSAVGIGLAGLRGDRLGARRSTGEVEWLLVLPLGLGIICALGIGSAVIPTLLERYPVQMSALFFGLIVGSLALPWGRSGAAGPTRLVIAGAAAVVAFALVGLPPREVSDPGLVRVFLSAAVAICAMILPGVSGAFLLLVLGLYEHTLDAIKHLDLLYIAVFGAGAVLGLGAFSKLLSYLLDEHHDLTMAALTGLMAGSLRALWPWLTEDRGLLAPPGIGEALAALLIGVVGALAVMALIRVGGRRVETAPLTNAERD